MACMIDLEVTICHYPEEGKGGSQHTGKSRCFMGFPPPLETNFGPSDILTVCSVHYLGVAGGTDKDHYRIRFHTIQCPCHRPSHTRSCDEIIVREMTPWLDWEFTEDNVKDESEDPQEPE